MMSQKDITPPSIDKYTHKYSHGNKPVSAFADGKPTWLGLDGELVTGVYIDMPSEDYHKIKAVSSSLIKKMAFDPHKAEEYWKGEADIDITPQLKRSFNAGHLLHGLILEPDIDHGVISPLPNDVLEKKTGKKVIENHDDLKKFLQDNGLGKGKNIAERVTLANQYKDIIYYPFYLDDFKERDQNGERTLALEDFERIEETVARFKETKPYEVDYKYGGFSELTVIAFDTERSCYVKARIDRITEDGLMRDLKTIHNLSEDDIRRDLENRLYIIQGAFYQYVCQLINFDFVDPNQFALTFIEWDKCIRFSTVEVDRGSWEQSKEYMFEIFDDLILWLGDKVTKSSLNHSQSLVMNLSYYKLKRRPRVQS
ncbi:hypothetical protein UA32_11940 [Photobacterium angustum]|uniref:Putative exodeoxyribonuclease 8 PDDEXK-like domain-containing protein n=1 Tax=Photobacterium angustum TaxID=661 RepID=A0ABX5GYZ0_PHOAN|nr:PD-(D/E)XK nuclease-like domain-containing protein [Photobacterium angustum]KJG37668.1 hypothetical protein UA32_11940 [Photobacterium angustum]PSX01661.1 hypothetical protein C0W27_21985 [Photobacterium angustum]